MHSPYYKVGTWYYFKLETDHITWMIVLFAGEDDRRKLKVKDRFIKWKGGKLCFYDNEAVVVGGCISEEVPPSEVERIKNEYCLSLL